MATKTETPLRLHRLEISSFMGIKGCVIDADGKHVVITGKNGSGKSSTVNAIWACLGGLKSAELPAPIHHDDDHAEVTIDLGEYKVTRSWETDKRPKLTITTRDGATAGADILKGFLASYALDPVAFLARRDQDMIDDVLGVAEVAPPVDQVEEITGERHEPEEGESADRYLQRLGGDKTGTYYLRRLDAHRELDRKRKALAESKAELDKLAPAEEGPSTDDVLKRMQQLELQADKRRAVEQAAQRAAAALEETQTKAARRRSELAAAKAEADRLRAALAEAEKKQAELQGICDRAALVIAEDEAEAKATAAALEQLPDPMPAIKAARLELQQAEQHKLKLAERQIMQRQVVRLEEEAQAGQAAYDAMDAVLTRLRAQRQNLLNGVDLGVPGLEIGEGELRLNGVPFKQASTSERLKVACAVAMMQQPRLRLLRVDNGEALDSDSRALLFRIATLNDFQCVFTAVADSSDLKVEIVDR